MDKKDQLQQIITALKVMPRPANTLYTEHLSLWQSLGFSQTQVALWLASLATSNSQKESSSQYQVKPDITEHLISLLQQSGGRMPLSQVLRKLPAGITTSEQQICKLAQQHAQLGIKGPLMVLVN